MDRRLFITSLAAIPAGLMIGAGKSLAVETDSPGDDSTDDDTPGDDSTDDDVEGTVIYGNVSNKFTRGPVAGKTVTVTAGKDKGEVLGSAETDEDGLYEIEGLSLSDGDRIRVTCDAKGSKPTNVKVKSEDIIVNFESKEKGDHGDDDDDKGRGRGKGKGKKKKDGHDDNGDEEKEEDGHDDEDGPGKEEDGPGHGKSGKRSKK